MIQTEGRQDRAGLADTSFCCVLEQGKDLLVFSLEMESDSSSTSSSNVSDVDDFEEEGVFVAAAEVIRPYQNEPLAVAADNGDDDGLAEDDQEEDEDGLSLRILERRFEKTDPVREW